MFSNPTPSKPRLSPATTTSDDTLSALTPPLHCASIVKPATPLQVFAFSSWTISAPICLNRFTFTESRKCDLWTCVCVFTFSSFAFAFLIEVNFSFKSLFAIWSLSPQRFHNYFYLSTVSWQYQQYSTILIFVLSLLCVTPLVCSSYSSFAPFSWSSFWVSFKQDYLSASFSPFFSSWWQKDCKLFTHTLVLQCSSSTSSCQPQTTHVFADSKIALLCHALSYALHMRRQNLVLFLCLYIEPFELVIEIIFHYCTTPPCLKINLLKVHSGAFALSASMMLLCCSLASSSFALRKFSFLSDDRLNSRMHSVWWFLVITVPSGLRFQRRCS